MTLINIYPEKTYIWPRGTQKGETALIIREMQSKTTMRYYLIPVRMAVFRKNANNNVGKDVEKREPSNTVGGNIKWCNHCGK